MNREKDIVLVTGGAGYIGIVVVKKLLDSGYRVRVLDKLIFTKEPMDKFLDKIELFDKDIRKVKSSVMDGVGAVIHLAGFSTEPTSQYDPRLTDIINHIATERLAKMARAKGIKRFVYASSCSVYFTLNTPMEPPLYKESDSVNPISCYSLTKRCSEQVLWAMTNDDFQPTIFRKGTLYGYSPKMRYDLVFNSFTKDAYVKKVLTVDAGGEIWRPMIDIQDAANAYVKSIELSLSKVGGKIFNVVDQNWKIGDLAEEFKRILKKKKVNVKLDVKPYGLTRNYKADAELFKKTFGFKRSRSIEEALAEIWDHLENDKEHDPNNPLYYSDIWYRKYFDTKEGKIFRRYV